MSVKVVHVFFKGVVLKGIRGPKVRRLSVWVENLGVELAGDLDTTECCQHKTYLCMQDFLVLTRHCCR